MPNSEVLCEPLICVKWHLKSVSTILRLSRESQCTWEEPTLAKIYSLGLFILMIAKKWTGILHGDRRRVFRTPDQKKLTVSLEHLILAIILVHLYFPMYIENISKSSSSLSLVWLPLQQAGCKISLYVQYLGMMYVLHPLLLHHSHKKHQKIIHNKNKWQ